MCFINFEILIHLSISITEDVPISHKNRAFRFPGIHIMSMRLEKPHPQVLPLALELGIFGPFNVFPSQKNTDMSKGTKIWFPD